MTRTHPSTPQNILRYIPETPGIDRLMIDHGTEQLPRYAFPRRRGCRPDPCRRVLHGISECTRRHHQHWLRGGTHRLSALADDPHGNASSLARIHRRGRAFHKGAVPTLASTRDFGTLVCGIYVLLKRAHTIASSTLAQNRRARRSYNRDEIQFLTALSNDSVLP